MQINIESFISIVPLIVSVISLAFSIKAIRRGEPNIKIRLLNKNTDAYYGPTKMSKDGSLTNFTAYVRFRISNKSLSPVTISEILLQKDKEKFELADKDADYWEEVIFYFDTNDEDIKTDGSYVDYKQCGITLPFVLKAYESKDITCIFMSFPRSTKKMIKSKLIIDTAVGIKCKGVDLFLYTDEYTHNQWVDIEQHLNSQ